MISFQDKIYIAKTQAYKPYVESGIINGKT